MRAFHTVQPHHFGSGAQPRAGFLSEPEGIFICNPTCAGRLPPPSERGGRRFLMRENASEWLASAYDSTFYTRKEEALGSMISKSPMVSRVTSRDRPIRSYVMTGVVAGALAAWNVGEAVSGQWDGIYIDEAFVVWPNKYLRLWDEDSHHWALASRAQGLERFVRRVRDLWPTGFIMANTGGNADLPGLTSMSLEGVGRKHTVFEAMGILNRRREETELRIAERVRMRQEGMEVRPGDPVPQVIWKSTSDPSVHAELENWQNFIPWLVLGQEIVEGEEQG